LTDLFEAVLTAALVEAVRQLVAALTRLILARCAPSPKPKGVSISAPECIGMSDAARRLGLPACAVSDAVYRGRLDGSKWPVVAGRRLVPVAELPAIKKAMVKK
jgi:hypothetical protein